MPFYSKLMQYPNNMIYAWNLAYTYVENAFLAARIGLDHNARAMEGPIERNSWDDISARAMTMFEKNLDGFFESF